MNKQAAARLLIMLVCVPLIALDIILAPHLPLNDPTLAAVIAFLGAAIVVFVVTRVINKLLAL